MAYQVIKALEGWPNVECIVAPYEVGALRGRQWVVLPIVKMGHGLYHDCDVQADAQLAYLCQNGHIGAVITEDSDLLTFACPRALFKADVDGTVEQVISPHSLVRCREERGGRYAMVAACLIASSSCRHLYNHLTHALLWFRSYTKTSSQASWGVWICPGLAPWISWLFASCQGVTTSLPSLAWASRR